MKKVLTIDGGGVKGIFPLSFLSTIEDTIQEKISEYFDLIVGTSTGGIIALGLGLGYSSSEILNFYEELVSDIFSGSHWFNNFKHLFISRYNPNPLKTSLESIFGDIRLGESKKRLVIPSMNLETGEVYLYKTSHHPRFERDYKTKVVDIALATASAPTYFPAFRSRDGIPLVDGGVWANNPTIVGVVEAKGVLDWDLSEVQLLSLGCTKESININWARRFPLGLGYWAVNIVNLILSGQSSGSNGMSKLLLGQQNFFRYNPISPKGRFKIDKISEIQSLKGLGASEARKALPQIKPLFFSNKVQEFIPCNN